MTPIDLIALTLRGTHLHLQISRLDGGLDIPVTIKLEEDQQLVFCQPQRYYIQHNVIEPVEVVEVRQGRKNYLTETGDMTTSSETWSKDLQMMPMVVESNDHHAPEFEEFRRDNTDGVKMEAVAGTADYSADQTADQTADYSADQTADYGVPAELNVAPSPLLDLPYANFTQQQNLSGSLCGTPQSADHYSMLSATEGGSTFTEYHGGQVQATLETLRSTTIHCARLEEWLRFPRRKFTNSDLRALRNILVAVRQAVPGSTRYVMEAIRAAMALLLADSNLMPGMTLQVLDVLKNLPSHIRNMKRLGRIPRPRAMATPTPRIRTLPANPWPLDETSTLNMCKDLCKRTMPIQVVPPRPPNKEPTPRFVDFTLYRRFDSCDWFVRESSDSCRPVAGPMMFTEGVTSLMEAYYTRSRVFPGAYAPLLNILQIILYNDFEFHIFPVNNHQLDVARSYGLNIQI